jgi:uncharacterized protein (TIGR01777 family)
MKTILIAGGTGKIGSVLTSYLSSKGYEVLILTRQPSKTNHFYWDPSKEEISDDLPFDKISVIINLSGAGIGDKTWSEKRRHEILMSRIVPTQFLTRQQKRFPHLKKLIQISGATCYGQNLKDHALETSQFGSDFLSQIVKQWEDVAKFERPVMTTMLRSGVVFYQGGALAKMIAPLKFRIGLNIGQGHQMIQWISINDLCRLFLYFIENEREGIFNAVCNNIQQKDLILAANQHFNKKAWFVKMPKKLLRLMLGEMSELLTESYPVSNEKLVHENFHFEEATIADVFNKYYGC